MEKESTLIGKHGDVVHDLSYDHYGKRLVTCHSDHKVRIWSEILSKYEGSKTEWNCDAELDGHKGSVWKADWAHPEYGQVIASCGADLQVIIWEEIEDETQDNPRWHKVATLNKDTRQQVTDIKFAPKHLGLSLASCSDDGIVRFFSADDVLNLENWTLRDQINTAEKPAHSVAWNQSRFDPQMIAVGTASKIQVWVKNESSRRWESCCNIDMLPGPVKCVAWSPNLGRSYHLIAGTCPESEKVMVWKLSWNEKEKSYCDTVLDGALDCDLHCDTRAESKSEPKSEPKSKVWRCAFNTTGTILATSSDNGKVLLWRKNFRSQWNMISEEFAS